MMDTSKSNNTFICPQCGKERDLSKKSKGLDICCYCKGANTSLEIYGVTSASKLESTKAKMKKTCVERYGSEWSLSSKQVREKGEQTMLARYGVSNASFSPQIITKAKATMLDRYGVESYSQTEEFKERIEATSLEKYGTTHPWKSKEIRDKQKQTCLERYGSEEYFGSQDAKEKIKKTSQEKYGTDYPMMAEENKLKQKKATFEKYGVESVLSLKSTHQKAAQTCQNRYGVENYAQTRESRQRASKKLKLMWNEDGLMRKHWYDWYSNLTDEQRRSIRQKSAKKYQYDEITFDSSWELAYFIYLIDHNIDFEFQCDPIEYQDLDGKKHLYFPDFKVGDRYKEIKGDHFFTESGQFINPFDRSKEADEHNAQKFKCMIDNNVDIIRGDSMIPILEYVEKTYGSTFLNECRIDD